MNKNLLARKEILLLIPLIAIGFFLRFYNLSNLFYYGIDEELMNLNQKRIILGQHFPLIGSFSPLGNFLGPYFYYLGSIFLFLSNLNPLGQAVFAGLLGTFNIFLIYIVSRQLFDKRIAIFSSIFYSLSFLMVIFDRRYWHLTFGPFLSLIVLWSLFKIKNGSYKFIYLLTLALILGINTDYTNLVLVLFTVIAWIVFKLPLMKRQLLVSLLIFLISSLPILVFDLRHDFLNTRKMIGYFSSKYQIISGGNGEKVRLPERTTLGESRTEQAWLGLTLPFYTFSRMIFVNSDLNITAQHSYCQSYILQRNNAQGLGLITLAVVILLIFLYLVYQSRKKKNSFQSYLLVLLFYLIFQLGIFIYAFVFKGDVFEHYLAPLVPYLIIILAIVTARLYQTKLKTVVFILVFTFCFLNFKNLLIAYNPLGFENKVKAAKFALSKIENRDYSLDALGSCHSWDGYYYIISLLGSHPVKSFQDSTYSWLYNYQPAEVHPDRVVVMVAKGRFEDKKFNETYKRYAKWVIDRKTFGDLEVLILDNSKGDF